MRIPGLALLLLLPSLCLSAPERIEFSEEGDFSALAITRGVKATQEQCAKASNAVWAVTKKSGAECLKYWAAGLSAGSTKRVIVYFHGDLWKGPGQTTQAYLRATNKKVQDDANSWAKRLNHPYIFFGRPGTYGSSGDHMKRRRIAESELISAALDVIKQRHGIEELVIAGQSGGGHVTSSLLTLRSDIVCAVPTSAPSSPRIRWEMKGRTKDTTGFSDSYEPSAHLRKEAMHPQLRVFVLGNPRDRNVLWPSQTVMADALRRANIPVEILEGEGAGPEAHGLPNSSRIIAGWCAQNMGTEEIVSRAKKGLKG